MGKQTGCNKTCNTPCNNDRGSFTVESSILFSAVFLLISAMVYLLIIMYQYVSIQSAANEFATIGAGEYVSVSAENNLYWRIVDSNRQNKIDRLEKDIHLSLNRSILSTDRNISINTSNRLLTKHINIKIVEEIPLPVGGLFEIFGISPVLSIAAEASSPLGDKAEFVRNLDTVIDIKNAIFHGSSQWIGKESKIHDVISKLIKQRG